MKKLFFLIVIALQLLIGVNIAWAQSAPPKMKEVSCSSMRENFSDGKVALGANDQCFVMPNDQKIYVGRKITNIGDYFNNTDKLSKFIFEDLPGEPGFDVKFSALQGNWAIDDKGDIMRWATTEEWGVKPIHDKTEDLHYRMYKPNTNHLMIRSEGDRGIHFRGVTTGMNKDKPAYRITFTTRSYTVQNGQWVGPVTHQEHAFYYAAWCGDGITQTEFGEVRDDGANNGKPGYISKDCKTDTPVPGVCDGASNGVPTRTAPTTNLCRSGVASTPRLDSTGTKYTWTCNGTGTSSAANHNASCEAPRIPDPVPGVCDGASAGVATYTAPTGKLCKTGVASTPVLDSTGTKFTWTCNGQSGGSNGTCEAPKKIDAVCDGASTGQATRTAPTKLCTTGTPSKVTTLADKFVWTCGGISGGQTKSCEAPRIPDPVPGVCDGASAGVATYTAPTGKLCKTGVASTPVLDSTGTKFTWTCNGQSGGSNGTCEAPKKIDAVCDGASTGQATRTAPTGKLCTTGVASTPVLDSTGTKFTWTCNGLQGGANKSCEAPKLVDPTEKVCDQTFPSRKLRLGQAPVFYDTYTNKNSFAHTLDSFHVSFTESDDMNKDGKATFAEHFQWVSPYQSGVKIPAGATNVKVISADRAYRIMQAPKVRKTDNLYLEYTITVDTPNGKTSHKECQPYEVTWCGDGIVDTDAGEICDPADTTKKGWGPNGCHNSNEGDLACKPKEGTPLDLSIKKYVDTNDAQPGNAVAKNVNDTFNYVIRVKVESGKTAGTTTVRDILPAGIDMTGGATGNGWTCTFNATNRLLECTSTSVVESGNYFADITVPVKVVTAQGEVRNDATVHNPNENPKSCYPDNKMPNGNEQSCETDPKNTDPAVIKVEKKNELRIKKYAGDKDGQLSSDALAVDYGKVFTYKYVVTATGSTDQKNVTVTDKVTQGVEVTGFEKVPAGWTCNNGQVTESGKVYHTVVCNTPTLAKDATVEIIVKAHLVTKADFEKLNLPAEVFTLGLRNIAYVCSDEVTGSNPLTGTTQTKVCDPKCVDPNNPSCLPPPPTVVCSAIPSHPHYDPACIVPTAPELEIKKYAKGQDSQTAATQVTVNAGEEFPYTFEVANTSKTDVTRGARVTDTFPSTIQVVKTGEGTNWTCSQKDQVMDCFYHGTIKVGEKAPTITAIVKTNATAKVGQSIRNVAAVCVPELARPEDSNGANAIGCTPNESICKPGDVNYNPTTKTCDPATVVVDEPKLQIKKFAKNIDAQTKNEKVTIAPGEEFPYTFEVTNTSAVDAKGVMVVDDFPSTIQVVKTGEGTDWACTQNGQQMTCRYAKVLKAGEKAPIITAIAKTNATAQSGQSIRNVAAVCELDPTKPITAIDCLPVRDACKPGDENYNPTTKTCDPVVVEILSPSLEIKKYAKGQDSQTAATQVTVNAGEEFPYTFEVTNTSAVDAKGVKVEDVFPSTIQVVTTGAGTDWTCTQNGQTMTCLYAKTLKAGEKAPTITAIAKTNTTAQAGQSIRNVAAVCELDPTKPANDSSCTPNSDACKPGDVNYNPTTKTCDPATVVVNNDLDLSIKKYIDQDDAQTAIRKEKNSTFNYVIRVKVESGTTSGVTTVKDVLPHGVELNGTPTGIEWNVTMNGKTLTATSTQVITTGNYFSDIIVPVRVTADNNQTVRNYAVVHNPNEKPKSCYSDNRMPNGNEENCSTDPRNVDPAIFKTPDSTTTTTTRQPYCGNYIVEAGEICDDGPNGSSTCGAPGTALACKPPVNPGNTTTNPAENALKFTITIPAFAKTSIGSSMTGKKTFDQNGVVVGRGSNIFALSDTVTLGFEDQYNVATAIPSTYEFIIHAKEGKSVTGESSASTLNGNSFPSWEHPDGTLYRLIGKNGSKFRIAANAKLLATGVQCSDEIVIDGNKIKVTGIKECTLNQDTSTITLFGGTDLKDIKATQTIGTEEVVLSVRGQGDLTSLASFPVEVIESRTTAVGSSVNRTARLFKNFETTIQTLKKNLTNQTTTNTTTASNSNTAFPFGTNTSVTPLNSGITNSASSDITISSLSQLEKYKHNGNANVYSVKFTNGGKLILKDLTLSGVKTVLVENGTIEFAGNTTYADNKASWAFIAKGNNAKISVKTDVTNLSGVFVAVEGATVEGEQSSKILRIEGAIYGNAQKLFDARTYARGTNAYDAVTAGTILNYSSRALSNPPPMLSNYLDHYKVQRVVR